ncbi:MAG: hypothetical protein D6815_00980 [Candidatus Dadabacteria bacterium]|nr:MAG: hypothetical protein D6815_00980 [Candidatus Dadabacteria bacterium]
MAVAAVGAVEVLVEALGPPEVIYAAGLAVIPACLATCGGRFELCNTWERLRANRLLVRAMLGELPAAGPSLAKRCCIADRELTRLLEQPETNRVHIYQPNGFRRTTGDEAGGSPVACVFTRTSPADAIENALAEAAEQGLSPVLIATGQTAVGQARARSLCAAANEEGIDVVWLPLPDRGGPPLVSYLLPATGAVERQIDLGRRAARSLLGSLAARPTVSRH